MRTKIIHPARAKTAKHEKADYVVPEEYADVADKDTPLLSDEDEFPEEPERRGTRLHETATGKERVILVGVSRPSQQPYETDDHLAELALLAETAGAEVVETMYQNRTSVDAATFIGKGKVEFLGQRCEETNVYTIIFDDDLSPVQQRNLEKALNRKVIDRTGLILDIFVSHARTLEAKTQVELAQLEYLMPRLTGLWTHLSKQYGGIRTKGPGETQIETDRRIVKDRISHLRKKLDKISQQRHTQRKGRKDSFKISLIGYTNAGKSTLLNMLTDAGVLAEDKLFATLDSTTRSFGLDRHTVLVTDTVGFIRKLPAKLVASFKSTLEEVTDADLLIHVIDASHPLFREQIEVVNQILKELGAENKPIIHAFNKIDALPDMAALPVLRKRYANTVCISASRGINIGDLRTAVTTIIEQQAQVRRLILQPPDFRIMSEIRKTARIRSEEYTDDAILIECEMPSDEFLRLQKRYPDAVFERD